jgi:SPP1 family predicted phage head-tail adaptor
MNPGALNQRLTLEIPLETADGAGGVIRTYAAGPLLWANVTALRARHETVAGGSGATVTHRILVRTGPEITTRHRLSQGVRRFIIRAVHDDDASGRFLRIEAEERRD